MMLLPAAFLLLAAAPATEHSDHSGRDRAKSFAAEADVLYRTLACSGAPQLAPPAELDAQRLQAFCAALAPTIERFQRIDDLIARDFFRALAPPDAPGVAVYPFGTGDLAYLLMSFRDARELITLSPEPTGDPRRVPSLPSARLAASLGRIRALAERLFYTGLDMPPGFGSIDPDGLPAQLSLFMLGLAAHGYRPVELKYFRVEDDGTLEYLSEEDFAACEGGGARPKPAFRRACEAFSNSELQFVPVDDPRAPPRVHYHLATGLADDRLKHGPVLRWLQRQGPVGAMAKGAGFHLWQPEYSALREYLLGNMRFMVSDSTGIPPVLAKRSGFVQQTYGHYFGSAVPTNPEYDRQLESLWSSPATRTLLFRYGHVDKEEYLHLMVTRTATPGMSYSSFALDPHAERVDVQDEVEGGRHWRLWTAHGGLHVWIPRGYAPARAGTVIYVHGYYVSTDEAWKEHRLAEQFRASGRNALFIVPEACASDPEDPFWDDADALQETVLRITKLKPPAGPLVVAAHSGGFRSAMLWLDSPRIAQLLFLDALYAKPVPKIRDWLRADPTGRAHTLVLTSTSTADRSVAFTQNMRRSVMLPGIPEDLAQLAPEERRAQVLYMPSQLSHMDLVLSGKVIPLLLQLSPIPPVAVKRE